MNRDKTIQEFRKKFNIPNGIYNGETVNRIPVWLIHVDSNRLEQFLLAKLDELEKTYYTEDLPNYTESEYKRGRQEARKEFAAIVEEFRILKESPRTAEFHLTPQIYRERGWNAALDAVLDKLMKGE